jgi:peptide deformylase
MPTDVASLKIVTYPDPVLLKRAGPVPGVREGEVSDEVRQVAERMLALMREADGIGLAAPQVGLAWRMFVVDVPPPEDEDGEELTGETEHPTFTDGPEVYINPVFARPVGPPEAMEEGCLSLPGIRGDVLRPPTVTISALDLDGQSFTQTASGLLARCWQHEMDHLDGVLIISRFTQVSRIKTRTAVKNLDARGRRR